MFTTSPAAAPTSSVTVKPDVVVKSDGSKITPFIVTNKLAAINDIDNPLSSLPENAVCPAVAVYSNSVSDAIPDDDAAIQLAPSYTCMALDEFEKYKAP